MTVHIWQSLTGDFGAAGSWDSSVPVVDWAGTDTGLLDGSKSQQSVTTGLDQSAEVIRNIYTTRDYRGNIGFPGAPLKITASHFVLHGSGVAHIEPQTVGCKVIVDSVNVRDAVNIYGTVTFVFVRRGKTTVVASASCTSLGAMGTFGDRARLDIVGTDVDGPQFLYVVAGEIHNYRWGMSHATLFSEWMLGASGRLYQYGTLKSTSGNPPAIYDLGGKVFLRCPAVGGTKKVVWASGQIDMSGSEESFSSLTDSLIGPDLLLTKAPRQEADDISFDLTDLQKDFPT